MQIVFADGERQRELDVRVNNPAATVADLAEALHPDGRDDGDRPLLIGDVQADPDLELIDAGLYEGAVVRFGAPGSGTSRVFAGADTQAATEAGDGLAPARELVVVNGLDAGRRFPLHPGTALIGRAPGCEIVLRHDTVSKRHASLTVAPDGECTIEDLDSHNGTWVASVAVIDPTPVAEDVPIRIGALRLELRPRRDDDRPVAVDPVRHTTAAGTIPFNRPPRPAPAPPVEPLDPPQPPRSGGAKTPFSVISIVAPLIFAGAMYAVMKSPQYLLFAGLSPLMAIGNAVDSRRRSKKTEKGDRSRFRDELAEFLVGLDEKLDEKRRHRGAAYPDPVEIVRRVTLPSTTLWERRPADPDFLLLRAGLGDVPSPAPVTKVERPNLPEELAAALEDASTLTDSPVPVDLGDGGVVGIVGDRDGALALARSLVCQAATLHGPADLPMMVLAAEGSGPAWDWAKWLPHTRDSTGAARLLSGERESSTRMVESVLKTDSDRRSGRDKRERSNPADRGRDRERRVSGPTMLVVVDDESLTEGRKAPTRNLLRGDGGAVAGIVIASTSDRLPAVCTTVVEMKGGAGEADLTLPQQGVRISGFVACGFSDDVARGCARALARFEDAELDLVGAGLPASIRLLPLLDLEDCNASAITARWKAGGIDPPPATPIGVAEDGIFAIDFVVDGPHGLVGGTTGAGKSELLRTMVAGMAASVDPDHLTFVLVDFKGGSAFDECAKLPHTVGMVTDLDEHLAERALRCLEAELKYRERLLRSSGAIDLPDYVRSARDGEPLPRLLVIIDEFATLKAELPDFIDALVGVAQRGRSLGVHMLLATQRPQGAISENIRANTNLRIALRMQDRGDSTDVIDVPDAAAIPRTAPGRAYVRLGPNEVVAIQTALSTGARNEASTLPVDLAPFVYGPQPRPAAVSSAGGNDPGPGAVDKSATDLGVLVASINEAFARSARPAPRRPWPDPLPTEIDLDPLIDGAVAEAGAAADGAGDAELGFVPVALADDPDAQRQYPSGWRMADGNLLVYGLGGSGTTTLLSSLALSLARVRSPETLHLYVIDYGAGELAPLADLPHCGGVVLANERERQQRLIRFLRSELDRRRQLSGPDRAGLASIVTMIDGWPAMVADYQDIAGQELIEGFIRVCADGPEVGLFAVITGDRAGAISHLIASTVRQRWVLRMANTSDYSVADISARAVPTMLPGHALVSESKQLVHVARPADGLEAAVDRRRAETPPVTPGRGPARIATLPGLVRLKELGGQATLDRRPWVLPIGMAERDLGTASLVAYEGEHALVAGPARSGKSTTLLTVATAVLAEVPTALVVAMAHPRSPLVGDPRINRVVDPGAPEELLPLVASEVPLVLVLVDDAETIDEPRLENLGTSRRANLLVVAAGRSDLLRTGYNHWTRPLRRSKLGVLLRPDPDLDGDILGAKLPRRPPVAMSVGRGYIVSSAEPVLAQIAFEEPMPTGPHG